MKIGTGLASIIAAIGLLGAVNAFAGDTPKRGGT